MRWCAKCIRGQEISFPFEASSNYAGISELWWVWWRVVLDPGNNGMRSISHQLLKEKCRVIQDSLKTIALNGIHCIYRDNWTASTDFDILFVGHRGQDQKKGQDQGRHQSQALAGGTRSHTRSTSTGAMVPETKFATEKRRKRKLNSQRKRKGES